MIRKDIDLLVKACRELHLPEKVVEVPNWVFFNSIVDQHDSAAIKIMN